MSLSKPRLLISSLAVVLGLTCTAAPLLAVAPAKVTAPTNVVAPARSGQSANPGGMLNPVVGPAVKSARLQQLQSLVNNKGWLKDPFRYLQSNMVEVIEDLAASETHVPAEVTEPKIISRLDVLIEMLEKQCKKGGGGNPNRPLPRSILAGGPGGQGDLNAPRNSRRKWAELTPKERERILQSKTEGFPVGYEDLLSEYFRRLATENSVRAIASPAGKTAPGKAP
jgi:hypothetical protein